MLCNLLISLVCSQCTWSAKVCAGTGSRPYAFTCAQCHPSLWTPSAKRSALTHICCSCPTFTRACPSPMQIRSTDDLLCILCSHCACGLFARPPALGCTVWRAAVGSQAELDLPTWRAALGDAQPTALLTLSSPRLVVPLAAREIASEGVSARPRAPPCGARWPVPVSSVRRLM